MFFFRTQLVLMYDLQFVRIYILCYQNHINITIRYKCIYFFVLIVTSKGKTSVQNWSNIQTFDTWTIYMYVCGFLGQGNFTFLLTTMLSGIVLSGIVQYWQWLNGALHLNPLVLLWESRLCVCQVYYGKYLRFRQQINLLWVKGIKSLKRVSVLNNDMFLQSQWLYICIFEETRSIFFYFLLRNS